MRPWLLACLLTVVAATETAAQETCRQFSWSVGRRINLFDDYLPLVRSAQSLPKEGAFSLELKPADEVIYFVVPERGQDSGYGGLVTIEYLPAGRYQIALSQEAWVDAVQDNARLPILAVDRSSHCPGVRQSVEVAVQGQPLTIQIGGARAQRLSIAVVRIWPFDWRW